MPFEKLNERISQYIQFAVLGANYQKIGGEQGDALVRELEAKSEI
jgi:hypothetical protein